MNLLLNVGVPLMVAIILAFIFRKNLKAGINKLMGSSDPKNPWLDQEVGEGVEWSSHGSYWIWIVASITFFAFGFNTGNWILFLMGTFTSLILVTGIAIIPNKPPHFAIVTRWGKRLWKWERNKQGKMVPVVVYADEGWSFIPFKGIKYDVIVINMSKREIDFPEEVLTTPDNATTKVPGSLAYTPNKKHIIAFLNLGTENPFKVFEDMMFDIWKDKLRTWARTKNKGPQTWEQLLSSDEEAMEMLLEAICGNVDIPPEERKAIRSGYGKWPVDHFGVYLNRLNLTDMKPEGEIYEASLLKEKEKRERNAEVYEVKTEVLRAKELRKEFRKLGIEKTIEECVVLVMRWKIQREANQLLTLSAFAKSFADAFKTQPV